MTKPDPTTSLRHSWNVTLPDGREMPWRGFYTGPLTLADDEIESLCRKLLSMDSVGLQEVASCELRPVTAASKMGPALILHSATPDLKSLESDLDKLTHAKPADHTTYIEARSVYLARPGDLAVGRTSAWKTAADLDGVRTVEIPGIDYYYLSHALLLLAERHLSSPVPQIDRIVEFLRTEPNTVARLYALEKEMQIFLVWLKRLARLDTLATDANSPEVARAWNRKSAFYPRVGDARALRGDVAGLSPRRILDLESRSSPLRRELGVSLPVLPGYTLERSGQDLPGFIAQAVRAARLLRQRYRLRFGCLKASEAGDGGRINPGVELAGEAGIETLARNAYRYGDDYVLEAHMRYSRVSIGEQKLDVAPSAHIRWGHVADGLTCQIMAGTSWQGNVFLDEPSAESFGVSPAHYRTIMESMRSFLRPFRERNLGLTIAGIDFAIGRIGGAFGDEVLLAAQDPNISFTGAESLRIFLDKAREPRSAGRNGPLYGVTRVVRPSFRGPLPVLRAAVAESGADATAISSIPGRWGMIAVADEEPATALEEMSSLHDALIESNLID